MSSSYVSNHVHMVFSTKERCRIIREEIQPKLWAYIAVIASNSGMHAVEINGIEDHAHALVNLGATISIAKAVQVLKANSSRWMNEHPGARFDWQDGYFACSVSRSQVAGVRRYIQKQKEHHAKMDSTKEFELLLKKHGMKLPR